MTKKQIKQVEDALMSIITDEDQCMEFRLNAVHALSEFEDVVMSAEEPEGFDWLRNQKLLDE